MPALDKRYIYTCITHMKNTQFPKRAFFATIPSTRKSLRTALVLLINPILLRRNLYYVTFYFTA